MDFNINENFFSDLEDLGVSDANDKLSEVLNVETEEKEFVDDKDFNVFDDDEIVVESPDETQRKETPKRIISYKEEATAYIELFDKLQTVTLTKVYQMKMFAPVEVERLKILKTAMSNGSYVENDADLTLLDKLSEYEVMCNAVPMDKTEIDKIATPLGKCLEMWQTNPSPTKVLLGAILAVEVPRLLPLLPKISLFGK